MEISRDRLEPKPDIVRAAAPDRGLEILDDRRGQPGNVAVHRPAVGAGKVPGEVDDIGAASLARKTAGKRRGEVAVGDREATQAELELIRASFQLIWPLSESICSGLSAKIPGSSIATCSEPSTTLPPFSLASNRPVSPRIRETRRGRARRASRSLPARCSSADSPRRPSTRRSGFVRCRAARLRPDARGRPAETAGTRRAVRGGQVDPIGVDLATGRRCAFGLRQRTRKSAGGTTIRPGSERELAAEDFEALPVALARAQPPLQVIEFQQRSVPGHAARNLGKRDVGVSRVEVLPCRSSHRRTPPLPERISNG